MAGDDSRRDMPVGDGVLPWDQLLPAARAAGAEWYIIEQDHPQDPLADVERSLRNLEALLGA
jgi:sugar phosphate isomerase/epimerase